jgi:uncharacterized protein YbjQ (UPF0145 family)
MRDIPRIVTGISFIILGLGLVVYILTSGSYVLSAAGAIFLILGIVILFNKKENKIAGNEKEIITKNVIVTTMNDIPGRKVKKILGVVRGNTVRSRNIGRDIMAGFKTIVGGEIGTFTELVNQSRDEAYNRMVHKAIDLGADGIIAMRFDASSVLKNTSEILAYGTAVKLD